MSMDKFDMVDLESDDSPDHIDDDEIPKLIRNESWGMGKIAQSRRPTHHWWAWRASSLGDVLANPYSVHNWELRLAGQAIAQHPDLAQLLQSIPLLNQEQKPGETDEAFKERMRPYRDEADGVMRLALDRAGAHRKANRGTALHRIDEAVFRGEKLGPIDPVLHAGLDKLHDLRRGFRIHEMERFVVVEDLEHLEKPERCRVCGTVDATGSLLPGWSMILPNGQPWLPGQRRVFDTKGGDGKIQKPPYFTQPWGYAVGTPYDYRITMAQRQAGDNGLRDWADNVAPETDYALIAHVPLSSLQDAGLWYVDLGKAEEFARKAAVIRTYYSEATRLIRTHFHSATAVPGDDVERIVDGLAGVGELPTVQQVLAPAADAERANTVDLIAREIRKCKDWAQLNAVFEKYNGAGHWTAEHQTLAMRCWDEVAAK